MLNRKMKPIAAAVGAAFAASLATGIAIADEADVDPFEAQMLAEGTLFADAHGDGSDEGGEGSCGEGKCGESEGKDKDKSDDSEGEDDSDETEEE